MILKALLKKELIEFFKNFFTDRKTGKLRPKNKVILTFSVFALGFIFIGFSFYGWSEMMIRSLLPLELNWLYYSFLGVMSVMLGVFGSVFNTYAGLYHAKDNELLLSMPIKPGYIITSRISGVFVLCLLFESIVILPGIICYWVHVPSTPANIILPLFLMLILAFFIVSVTCALGWVIALIASRLRNKNIIVVILSLIAFSLYYFVCFRFQSILTAFAAHAEEIGTRIKATVFPLYAFGMGCSGHFLYFLFFVLFAAACFALTCFVLSKSYMRIVTSSKTAKKKVYVEKTSAAGNADSALFKKELRRFLSSPTYMMNSGLGLFILLVFSIMLFIKGNDLIVMVAQVFNGYEKIIPRILFGAVCLVCSLNMITAPSVSLEGKSIQLTQSLPVDMFKVLMAKLKLHVALNAVPAVVAVEALAFVLKLQASAYVLMPLCILTFVCLTGLVGLLFDLKMPNLTWTNETVPIKQGRPVLFTMLVGWAISILSIVVAYVFRYSLSFNVFLIVFALIYSVASFVILRWFRSKGAYVFQTL